MSKDLYNKPQRGDELQDLNGRKTILIDHIRALKQELQESEQELEKLTKKIANHKNNK